MGTRAKMLTILTCVGRDNTQVMYFCEHKYIYDSHNRYIDTVLTNYLGIEKMLKIIPLENFGISSGTVFNKRPYRTHLGTFQSNLTDVPMKYQFDK